MKKKLNAIVITMVPQTCGIVSVSIPKGMSSEELTEIFAIIKAKFKEHLNTRPEESGLCLLNDEDIRNNLDEVDLAITEFKSICGTKSPHEIFWSNYNSAQVINLCSVIHRNLNGETERKLAKADLHWVFVYVSNAIIK